MADGSFWDAIQAPEWLRSIFGGPSKFGDMTGAAQAVASGTPTDTEMAAWAMNPMLSGMAETPQNLAATTDLGSGSGTQAGGNALASALKNLSGDVNKAAAQQSQNYAKPPDTTKMSSPIGRPTAPSGLNNLAQMLVQRQQSLMQPGQTGGASTPYAGQRQLGLLGF